MEDLSFERDRSEQPAGNRQGSWDVFDESADWEKVKPSKGQDDDEDDEQKRLFASGRRLFKGLQLDLSSFGLEKAGLAHQFASLITKERINLLYSSTFRYVDLFILMAQADVVLTTRTANILVAKRHIRKARHALESASR